MLRLATGALTATCGTISVLGEPPAVSPAQLARVGYVAQDTPVYARMRVADHLRLGAWLNPGWDDELAQRRIAQVGLDPKQRAGSLSGGQRAQLALTLALAKRPELLLLDEPVASLDPLARREFLRGLMEAVAEHGTSVVLSSHLVTDLERVCDYLIVLVASQVRIAGEVSDAARLPSPAVRTPPRPRHPPGGPGRHRGKPHRQAEHPAGPHRRADPRPGLDRHAGQHGGTRPRLHEPGERHPGPQAAARSGVMIRLTWLQFRTQAVTALAAMAAFAILLAATGPHLASLYAASGLSGCQGGGCQNLAGPSPRRQAPTRRCT